MQIGDDKLDLRTVLPFHFLALPSARTSPKEYSISLLQLIRNLAFDKRDHDNALAGAHRYHLMYRSRRIKYGGPCRALDADRPPVPR